MEVIFTLSKTDLLLIQMIFMRSNAEGLHCSSALILIIEIVKIFLLIIHISRIDLFSRNFQLLNLSPN